MQSSRSRRVGTSGTRVNVHGEVDPFTRVYPGKKGGIPRGRPQRHLEISRVARRPYKTPEVPLTNCRLNRARKANEEEEEEEASRGVKDFCTRRCVLLGREEKEEKKKKFYQKEGDKGV